MNLTFSQTNDIPDCVLSASPEPVTSVDNLKQDFRARLSRWTSLSGDIVIEGVLPEPRFADYLALPAGHTLSSDARLKLELFETNTSTVDVLGEDFFEIGHLIPLGLWRVGVDPFGGRMMPPNHTIAHWLPRLVEYQKFRLTIEHNISDAGDPVFGSARKADDFGTVALEGENPTSQLTNTTSPTSVLVIEDDINASGGKMIRAAGPGAFNDPLTSAQAHYRFESGPAGTFAVWVRMKTIQNDSIHFGIDNANYAQFSIPSAESDGIYRWYQLADITVAADTEYELSVAMREAGPSVDKIVIQSMASGAPSNFGPDESEFPQIGTENHLDLRMLMLGRRFTTEYNAQKGVDCQLLGSTGGRETESGLSVNTRAPLRAKRLSMRLPFMTDGDRLLLTRLESDLDGRSVLVSVHPEKEGWFASDHQMLAHFESPISVRDWMIGRHTTEFTMKEA